MKWHVMAVKDVYYLSISLYAKGNLSLNDKKPISAHGFSAIRRFLRRSSTMSQLAMDNGERREKFVNVKFEGLTT